MKPNQKYINWRNQFITAAVAYADKLIGKISPKGGDAEKERYDNRWNMCYHGRMEQLVKENWDTFKKGE